MIQVGVVVPLCEIVILLFLSEIGSNFAYGLLDLFCIWTFGLIIRFTLHSIVPLFHQRVPSTTPHIYTCL